MVLVLERWYTLWHLKRMIVNISFLTCLKSLGEIIGNQFGKLAISTLSELWYNRKPINQNMKKEQIAMPKAENNAYRVKTDGFHGELFFPVEDKYPGKALICFSGSDGKFGLSCMLASVF